MDQRDSNMFDSSLDWNDPDFASTQFEDAMPAESPFGASSTFDNYANINDFMDSPGGLTMRNSSKPALDFTSTPQHHVHMQPTRSAESSSQDSASDTSSSRKRKTTSESPASDAHDSNEKSRLAAKGDTMVDVAGERRKNMPIHPPRVDMSQRTAQSMAGPQALFDFNSAASSPINTGAFDAALSLDEQVHGMMMPQVSTAFKQQISPVRTINPANFSLDGSRDQSPASNNMMFTNTSPRTMFTSTSSESNDAYAAAQGWHSSMAQNPAWPTDFNSAAQFSPTGGLNFTPSPTSGGLMMATSARKPSARPGRSQLHIAPISAKSRVETQISIIMTLETPPLGIEYLHLPLQTIAKSKLLAKEEVENNKILELHTMLVCTSAMRNPQLKAKALRRAAAQNNLEVQLRAESQRDTGDEDKNDPKLVPDEDKPSNGGEVRICNNCIQRERKRAARKKLKKEEEQQHWERYETERVVVFNSSELLQFKAWDTQNEATSNDDYSAPDGAIQVSAAMRIACYCRHQNEKEGFQVIFTMKDSDGNVVAQEMSDSILITDDHKTHPAGFSNQLSDQALFSGTSAYTSHGLPTSYSMIDISQAVQPGFTASRSAGNLQAMAYPNQYTQGHVHQMQGGAFSPGTSATMTPTSSLSRPGSPTSAGNSGPNKKRKSSSGHRKMPSGLTMTPRVETNIPSSSAAPSAVSMMSQFSPTTSGANFMQQQDQSYVQATGVSNAAMYAGSGPPTPSENLQYANQQLAQANNHSRNNPQQLPDYYQSLPGSRVNSRAPSPVLQSTRPNIAAYARQQMAQGNTPRSQVFSQGMAQPAESDASALPMIHKITPTEGPVSGGTEVSIYGRDFAQGMQVYFGDQPATAITFYGEQALLCTSPPGRVGGVQVMVLPVGHVPQYNPSQASRPVFTYKNANEKVMEMALRFVSQQQTGNPSAWWQVTQQNATRWMQQTINRTAGFPTSYGADPNMVERMVNNVVDTFDLSEVADPLTLDATFITGETPLCLASASGLQESVRSLLVRGANPDGRDSDGFTPLMHAALHSKTRIFQLLITRGADSTVRSLSGFTALDVAPQHGRAFLQQILLDTPRSRMSRPSLKICNRSTSFASTAQSRDVSSVSMYESEDGCSEGTKPSARCLSMSSPDIEDEIETARNRLHAFAAEDTAVQDSVSLNIQHINQTIQKSVLQLPCSDRQEHALLRRLATLVHTLNDTFSRLSATAVLPPAYSELYPEKMQITNGSAKHDDMKTAEATQSSRPMSCEQGSWMLMQVVSWLCVSLSTIDLLGYANAQQGLLLVVLTAGILHAFKANADQSVLVDARSRCFEVL